MLHSDQTKHLVMFSGGVGSWATAKRVAQEFGQENLKLIFADTKIEDEDLYRFIGDVVENLPEAEFIWLEEGRTPWEVFRDVRFIGNTRVDPCSKILKRDLIRKYIEEQFSPANSVVYLGIDWTETHRLERARPHWEPWTIRAPMCERPFMDKSQMIDWLRSEGIDPPRLYDLGFPHNNCGGFCVKAGQAQFKLLLEKMPERYAHHEAQEAALRRELGKDVAILRCRRKQSLDANNGKPKPLTLTDLRLRVLDNEEQLDFGGCGCFSDF